jgi:serine protease Do
MNEIRLRRWAAVVLLFVLVIAGALVGSFATARANRGAPSFVTPAAGSDSGPVSFENGLAPVVEKVLPAVVNISSTKTVKIAGGNPSLPFLNDPFFRQFFGRDFRGQPRIPQEQREHSLGSGVIVSPDGYILTNNHVVEGATDIRVALPDRRDFKGRVVGADPKTDLAVVKIDQRNLPTLAMGDSTKVRTGNFVLAVGDPFGVGETVTMGIVSATGRGGFGIEDIEDFIQTDAAINPGNSGGALTDVRGRLIGINTAILTGGSSGNQGVGFAIPVALAQRVMQQIIQSGKVTRGWLGVVIQPVTPQIAQAFGLSENKGALVGDVEPGSPAARAGLQKGDVILQLNGQPIVDARALSLAASQMAPGSSVRLTIFRNGKQQDVNATLGEMPNRNPGAASQGGSTPANALSGVAVSNLTPDIAQQLNLPPSTRGAVVAEVADGSPAAEAGLQRGDVIQEVNRQPVRSVTDFNNAVRQAGNKPVLLLVNSGGNTRYVVIQPQ